MPFVYIFVLYEVIARCARFGAARVFSAGGDYSCFCAHYFALLSYFSCPVNTCFVTLLVHFQLGPTQASLFGYLSV